MRFITRMRVEFETWKLVAKKQYERLMVTERHFHLDLQVEEKSGTSTSFQHSETKNSVLRNLQRNWHNQQCLSKGSWRVNKIAMFDVQARAGEGESSLREEKCPSCPDIKRKENSMLPRDSPLREQLEEPRPQEEHVWAIIKILYE